MLSTQILPVYLIFPPQAHKEAFDVICNKGIPESSSAELLATFCDNILKKGGSGKLSDEVIEDKLEKVCCTVLLFYYLFSFKFNVSFMEWA